MTWCQLHGRNISQEVHAIQARRYLELLDQGEYQQAWQAMTPLYRDLHLQQLWQNRNHTIRRAYGALTSRYVRQSRFRTTHKNAPDGKYVMIQFESIFEHKSKGYETVVMECTSDDKCSVVDYVIN